MKTQITFNFFQNECLKISENNLEALLSLENETISFQYDNFTNMINYNLSEFSFFRENEEYQFQLDFIAKKAFLKLKKYDSISINVLECTFERRRQSIELNYTLETDSDIKNKIEIKLKEGLL